MGKRQKKTKSDVLMGKRQKKTKSDVFSDDEEIVKSSSRYDNVANYDIETTINHKDDEEIDEDMAFNHNDNLKYAQYFDQSSDDENENEEDMMDISELLNTVPQNQSEIKRNHSYSGHEDDENSNSEEDISDENSNSEEDISVENSNSEEDGISDENSNSEEDDISDENSASALSSFVDSLDTKVSQASKKRKRKQPTLKTEAYEENEFNVTPSNQNASLSSTSKVKISDLMGVLKDTTSFDTLKKQYQLLDKEITNKKHLGGLVTAPLPHLLTEKINREAAFDETKKELKKWAKVVQDNRRAEHLSFPLNQPGKSVISNSSLVAKFKTENSMEEEVQKVLEAAQLSEKRQAHLETLQMNKLSKEEVSTRMAELAKMRSLMFFQEQKMKKIKKIKSKTYRKLKKKAKDKLEDGDEMDLETLKNLDPEAAKEKLMELERDRAQERMTLKHKNSGKWAKKMLSRRDNDSATRQALIEQLKKHDELKRKINGFNSSDDEDNDNDDMHSSSEDETEQCITNKAINELDSMKDAMNDSDVPTKGVFAMKFMRKHVQEQMEASKRNIDELKLKLENGEEEEFGSSEDDEVEELKRKDIGMVGSNKGRRVFDEDNVQKNRQDLSPVPTKVNKFGLIESVRSKAITLEKSKSLLKPLFEFESFFDDDESKSYGTANETSIDSKTVFNEADKMKTNDISSSSSSEIESENFFKENFPDNFIESTKTKKLDTPSAVSSDEEEEEEEGNSSNPWLSSSKSSKPLLKSIKEHDTKKNSTIAKQEKAFKKLSKKTKANVALFDDDEEEDPEVSNVKIDMDRLNKIQKTETNKVNKKPVLEKVEEEGKKIEKSAIVHEDSDSDSDFEENKEAEFQLVHKKNIKELSQFDVMRMAFADDHIDDEFEAEKLSVMEREKPKEIDLTLPGWGSWAGEGIKPKEKKFKKTIVTVDSIEGSKRKDSKLKKVIINEKRQKKSVKYMASQVPHGFENRNQYERMIQMPLGKEWQTAKTFQKINKPRVAVKAGAIIHPMKSANGGK